MTANRTPLDLDALEQLLSLHGLPWHVAPCKPDCPGSVVCTALRSVDGKKVAPEKVRAFAMLAQELLPALLDELRRLRAAGEWKPLLRDGLLQAEEGRSYLFAVEVDGGWEYFSDSIGWDADEETVPAWHDGGHGWSIERVTHFAPLPLPPVEGT